MTMVYGFEEIGEDLARPPLAARRALLASGVTVPIDTWQSMPLQARQAITLEGVKDTVSEYVVKNAVSSVLKRVRFMSAVKDPPLDSIPTPVVEALRTVRPLSLMEWQGLRPLDRYTLLAVSSNSRLLYRAIEEMTTGPSSTLSPVKLRPWMGMLAHAEVYMNRVAFGQIATGAVQSGKALVLARVAGVRAARAAHDVIDGYADKYAGPIELDSRFDADRGGYVWQGHVSTVDGEFFAAASLLAAATAAIALRDAVAGIDDKATVGEITLREESWSVGSSGFGEEATVQLSASRVRAISSGALPRVAPPEPSSPSSLTSPAKMSAAQARPLKTDPAQARPLKTNTQTGLPVWVAVLLVLSTLIAFGITALTLYKHR